MLLHKAWSSARRVSLVIAPCLSPPLIGQPPQGEVGGRFHMHTRHRRWAWLAWGWTWLAMQAIGTFFSCARVLKQRSGGVLVWVSKHALGTRTDRCVPGKAESVGWCVAWLPLEKITPRLARQGGPSLGSHPVAHVRFDLPQDEYFLSCGEPFWLFRSATLGCGGCDSDSGVSTATNSRPPPPS